jgi:hypothetical protein
MKKSPENPLRNPGIFSFLRLNHTSTNTIEALECEELGCTPNDVQGGGGKRPINEALVAKLRTCNVGKFEGLLLLLDGIPFSFWWKLVIWWTFLINIDTSVIENKLRNLEETFENP